MTIDIPTLRKAIATARLPWEPAGGWVGDQQRAQMQCANALPAALDEIERLAGARGEMEADRDAWRKVAEAWGRELADARARLSEVEAERDELRQQVSNLNGALEVLAGAEERYDQALAAAAASAELRDRAEAERDQERARAAAFENALADIGAVLREAADGKPVSICSWCAHPTANTPQNLRAHLDMCPQHPLRDVEAERDRLRSLVQADTARLNEIGAAARAYEARCAPALALEAAVLEWATHHMLRWVDRRHCPECERLHETIAACRAARAKRGTP